MAEEIISSGKHSYKYKKGQRLHLDEIYDVQGLAGNDWWESAGEEGSGEIIITQTITIRINWKKFG